MPLVRVKQKYQVTLPSAVRKAANIQECDTLEVSVEDGNVVLVPQAITDRKDSHTDSILDLIGSNKGSGLSTRVRQLRAEIGQFWWISLVGMRVPAAFSTKCL